MRGSLEPFRYLDLNWIGKGNVQTLTEADERGRHTIPASEMMMGLYLNELLLLLLQQHAPQPALFSAYKYTLHKLGDSAINKQIMMRFELYLLACLGLPVETQSDEAISSEMRYRFSLEEGISLASDPVVDSNSILIKGELILALQDIQSLQEHQWKELRAFLDAVFLRLTPRTINSRKLLNL